MSSSDFLVKIFKILFKQKIKMIILGFEIFVMRDTSDLR